jgi:hypothetical protein
MFHHEAALGKSKNATSYVALTTTGPGTNKKFTTVQTKNNVPGRPRYKLFVVE